VSFPPKINSGTASVLIAKMLSLDGVNEVRAGFIDYYRQDSGCK
jgi:hypothetical protein